jgi:hypothetical protein
MLKKNQERVQTLREQYELSQALVLANEKKQGEIPKKRKADEIINDEIKEHLHNERLRLFQMDWVFARDERYVRQLDEVFQGADQGTSK